MGVARPHYKWELIGLFWLAYFLNQGDRQIFNAVLPLIKADLHASDVQLGLIATVFTLIYGVLVPVAGCLGDLISRKWIVVLSLVTFSAGTLLTGLSGGLLALIFFRSIATGAGEASYYPAANSLIGQYHHGTRAQAMAIHQTAVYVGIVISSWMAGYIGETHGWRVTFYAFGFFGLLLAGALAWRLKDDRHDPDLPGESQRDAQPASKLGDVLRMVLRKPTFYFLSLAFAGQVFVNVGYMTWMPTFLFEKFHLPLKAAALYAMLYHYLFAFLGVMVGGRVSDRLAGRRPRIRMEVEGLGLLLGAPFIWLLGASSHLMIVYVGLAGFGLFRGFYDSNLFAALFDIMPPQCRSSANGLMLCCAFSMGAAAPVLLGFVKGAVSLGAGLSSLAFVYLFAAAMIFIALKLFFARDYHGETQPARSAG